MHRVVVTIKVINHSGRDEAMLMFKININDNPTIENMADTINLIRKHYINMLEIYNEMQKIEFNIYNMNNVNVDVMDNGAMTRLFISVLESMLVEKDMEHEKKIRHEMILQHEKELQYERNLEENLSRFGLYIGTRLYRKQNGIEYSYDENAYDKLGLSYSESKNFKETIQNICRNLPDVDHTQAKQDFSPTFNRANETPKITREMASFARWLINKYHNRPFDRREYHIEILAKFKLICDYLDQIEL